MIVFYLLSLVAAFAAAALAVQALVPSPGAEYAARERRTERAQAAAIKSPLIRIVWPLLVLLAPRAGALAGPAYRQAKTRQLAQAGLPPAIRGEHFMALKLLMAVLLPAFMALQIETFRHPVFVVAIGGLGYWLPDRMLTEQRRLRQLRILRALPSAVDMLTLAVEAGMDFLASLQRVGTKGPAGPLREEVSTVVNDIRLGQSRSDALKAFSDRVDLPEVASFVSVLVQADRLGSSISTVLRTQADRMRTERFQRAEKEGAKATQKLLFPLALFIFPAVLIVLIGPAVLSYLSVQGFP
jgi:tight adherence protein C